MMRFDQGGKSTAKTCIDAMMEKRKKKRYTMGILRKVENH